MKRSLRDFYEEKSGKKRLHVIINFTNKCPFRCRMCVVNASPFGRIQLSEPLIEKIYDGVKSLKKKYEISVDLSGGDFFLLGRDAIRILEEFGSLVGEERISLSATSIGYKYAIEIYKKRELLNKVRKLLSIDTLDPSRDRWRDFVSIKNAGFIKEYVGNLLDPELIYVGTVLHVFSTTVQNLKEIHDLLKMYHIGNWEIMRLYPTGRANRIYTSLLPRKEDLFTVLDYLLSIDESPFPEFQHVWWFAELPEKYKTKIKSRVSFPGCLMGTRITILPNGDVTLNGWATKEDGGGISTFTIGNINEKDLTEIVENLENEVTNRFVDYNERCQLGNRWWK